MSAMCGRSGISSLASNIPIQVDYVDYVEVRRRPQAGCQAWYVTIIGAISTQQTRGREKVKLIINCIFRRPKRTIETNL